MTMSPRGKIILNRYVFEAINSPHAVTILYDLETDATGLRADSQAEWLTHYRRSNPRPHASPNAKRLPRPARKAGKTTATSASAY